MGTAVLHHAYESPCRRLSHFVAQHTKSYCGRQALPSKHWVLNSSVNDLAAASCLAWAMVPRAIHSAQPSHTTRDVGGLLCPRSDRPQSWESCCSSAVCGIKPAALLCVQILLRYNSGDDTRHDLLQRRTQQTRLCSLMARPAKRSQCSSWLYISAHPPDMDTSSTFPSQHIETRTVLQRLYEHYHEDFLHRGRSGLRRGPRLGRQQLRPMRRKGPGGRCRYQPVLHQAGR